MVTRKHYFLPSLVPRLLCGGGGKRAWYTLLLQSRAKACSWNGRTRELPASEEPSTFVARSSSSTHSVVSGRQLLYEKLVSLLKLSMHKQCRPGSFLPAHAREPGNKAIFCPAQGFTWFYYTLPWLYLHSTLSLSGST